jgi:hypothetical protein
MDNRSRVAMALLAVLAVACDPGTSTAPSGVQATTAPTQVAVAIPTLFTPTPTHEPTARDASVAPPKPMDTTYSFVRETTSADQRTATREYRATWSEPDGAATKFLAYGLTSCPRASASTDGEPCVLPGMTISKSDLVLLGTAPGNTRSMAVIWSRNSGAGPDPYSAILLRATNTSGGSTFAILFSSQICYGCVY